MNDRIFWLIIIFMIFFSIMSGYIVILCLWKDYAAEQKLLKKDLNLTKEKMARIEIVDRNGVVLATDITLASLYANTKFMLTPKRIAHQVHSVFSDLDEIKLYRKLSAPKAFVWIKRNLTPDQERQIYNLGIPGLDFLQEFKRIYPNQQLVSHILGSVDIDNNGIAGLEYFIDQKNDQELLKNKDPVKLSIDLRIQYILYDELFSAYKTFHALGCAGLVMDALSGEILALVSLPSYDPNTYAQAQSWQTFNRVTLGTYEIGSTMKVLTLAAALDAGSVHVIDKIDVSEPIHFGKFIIHDYHPVHHPISVEEIFILSSNIGMARIALHMGAPILKDYFKKMGLFSPPFLEIPELGKPILPKKWTDISLMTISYGHGIAVSPLQAAVAFASVVNGGYKVEPTLFKRTTPLIRKKIFHEETSVLMRQLLRRVVTEGTGRQANLDSYAIIGKTGTAEKITNGHYMKKKNVSSFVSAFPADCPRYVMFIMIDEPQSTKNTYGHTTAGWNAAPVSKSITKRMAPILGYFPHSEKESQGEKKR